MTYRVPYLEVTGDTGRNLVEMWGGRLIGVKIVTRLSDESDECTFMFTNDPPYLTAPAENTPFTVKLGWSRDTAAIGGVYYFERVHLIGEPTEGEKVHYVCRSGQTADLYNENSQHFDADNGNKTLGDVFQNLFKRTGRVVDVAPRIAEMPIPNGYALQWNQSDIAFATDLARDVGAVIKPMGGKIIVVDRDAGQSVTGTSLGTLTIRKLPGYQYDVELEPRFQYQGVGVHWFDQDAGRLKLESQQSQGGSGATGGFAHPAGTQQGAAQLADTISRELRRFTGSGLFVMPGGPAAVAGIACACSGFPDPIDGTKWIAKEVTHDVKPEQGWITTVEVETDAS